MKVVGVVFKENGKAYTFSCHNINVKKGMKVVVETEKGKQFGMVATDVIEESEKRLLFPVKNILRIATKEDIQTHERNIKDALKAYKKCKELIEKYHLNMYLLDAEYTFDRSQLFFHFLSDARVDFRELAKSLASIYRTRIELRQIGVRDKAKMVGGTGICGMELCCKRFLNSFDTISINMAKNQNIALNPTKINGCCGRLLCCLNYEDDQYTECRKCLPNIGQKIKTDTGVGKVVSLDILNQEYSVLLENGNVITVSAKEKEMIK